MACLPPWSLVLVPAVLACPPALEAQAALEGRKAAKLREPFLRSASWTTDYNKARARAKREGKRIFAYFTRSYTSCGASQKLERGTLSTSDFRSFGDKVVLFCHITSRLPGEPYPDLLEEKGGMDFPALLFLNAGGRVLARPRQWTVDSFEKTNKALATIQKLRPRARRGDQTFANAILLAELELGRHGLAEAKALLSQHKTLTQKQSQRAEGILIRQEVEHIRRHHRPTEARRRFLRMKKSGRIPMDPLLHRIFWVNLLEHALEEEDMKLAKECLERLRAGWQDQAWHQIDRERFEKLAQRLAEEKRKQKR